MANPAVTYTFVNGNVADASQVNQNFSDLLAGLTDGSKSLNIDALTCAGTTTLNGDTVIGNASGDVSTVNATLSFVTTPKVDTIAEKTSGSGVTIDGVLLKDNTVTASGGLIIGNETLDVYDTGTWSPTVDSAANFGFGSAISYGTSTYTRIGNTVFCRIESIEATNITITDIDIRTIMVLTVSGLPTITGKEFYGSAAVIGPASTYHPIPVSIVNTGNLVEMRFAVKGSGIANGAAISIRSIFFWYKY